MSDIIGTLKQEILRLAEKKAKLHVSKARKVAAQYHREAVELRMLLKHREREIAYLKKQVQAEQPDDTQLVGTRFSAKSVRSQRRRLGLSAEQYGKVVGVSQLTILNWEVGKSRPRRAQLAALVAVRGIGKKDAMAKLATQ